MVTTVPSTPGRPQSEPEAVAPSGKPAGAVDSRFDEIESRLDQTDSDIRELHSRLHQLARELETERRLARSQRYGRYLVWGAVIAVLALLWISMKRRLGMF